MDFSDWQIEGFSMKQDLKFGTAEIRWITDTASIAFEFESFHPPYAYGSHAEGCPSYAATDRIEQSGRVKGTITLGDRVIPFDVVGHRDHSWGTRDWGAFQYYNWFQGQNEDGVSVHDWKFLVGGREHLRGYVCKDGLLAEVVDVQSKILFDDNAWHKSLTATILDDAGRTTEVHAEFYATYPLVPDPLITLREGAARATFDGKPGHGWLEVAWQPSYLAHMAANGPY
jgi:hypothetical protein